MLEVEAVLSVGVRRIHGQQSSLLLHFAVERRAGHRGVQHELVEIGLVRHGVVDLVPDIVRGVVLQAHDGRTQDLDPVRSKFAAEFLGIGSLELGIAGSRRFQPQPKPRDPQLHQFFHAVLANGVHG